eukprot:3047615-Pleurochrysis_carterae.AAC.1
MSTACSAAWSQKPVGAPQATSDARVSSIMDRIARSATPFNWWTCGGQVEVCTPFSDRNSVNSRERNSPALSLWRVPTMRAGR